LSLLNKSQNITDQVRPFLQATTAHWIVGLTIYTILTEDMQPERRVQLARFRRTATSFRETALADLFRLAIEMLQSINEGKISVGSSEEEYRLLRQVLLLCVNCLSFDFTGTMVDESGDDQPTVMIPYSWSILREIQISTLLFNFYKNCWTYAIINKLFA
jgi:exportin-7